MKMKLTLNIIHDMLNDSFLSNQAYETHYDVHTFVTKDKRLLVMFSHSHSQFYTIEKHKHVFDKNTRKGDHGFSFLLTTLILP